MLALVKSRWQECSFLIRFLFESRALVPFSYLLKKESKGVVSSGEKLNFKVFTELSLSFLSREELRIERGNKNSRMNEKVLSVP